MKKNTSFLLLFLIGLTFSQQSKTIQVMPKQHINTKKDKQTNYNKNTNYTKKRSFKTELNKKYSGKEFIYKEREPKKKKKEKKEKKEIDPNFLIQLKKIASFIGSAFPYILGLLVIFVIVKSFLGTNFKLLKINKRKPVKIKKMIYEDDDEYIENSNFDKLIKQAVFNKNYRLATRYYYLLSLQKMISKKQISYHKDKTNSDYLNEIKNKTVKSKYSYISYLYNYIWYGKFEINEHKFKTVKQHFTTFINLI